jgi:hypothetical protein
MTMGPWIHVLPILAANQTDVNQGFSFVKEVLPQITDVAGGLAGPRWHRLALAYGPVAPYYVHLLLMSMFVTILAYFCHISYIQIILQAQVELGEI